MGAIFLSKKENIRELTFEKCIKRGKVFLISTGTYIEECVDFS
jgi:hypothetical protein